MLRFQGSQVVGCGVLKSQSLNERGVQFLKPFRVGSVDVVVIPSSSAQHRCLNLHGSYIVL